MALKVGNVSLGTIERNGKRWDAESVWGCRASFGKRIDAKHWLLAVYAVIQGGNIIASRGNEDVERAVAGWPAVYDLREALEQQTRNA